MDLDTKWKSVRESRWFKALCVALSMVLAFSSVALLSAVMRVSGLYNDDAFTDPSVAKKGSLVQTAIFKAELDVIVNEITLLAGQKQLQQKAAALKKAKADSVAAALEQYKKDQATAIRKTLVFYAGLKNQNITNIGKDIPNYKVPTKTIKKVVAEDRDAPGLIRDLQQIVNGTRAGEDYLPYLQLANWLRSSDGVEYYNDSDMQDDPQDLTDYYTVAFTVDGKTVSADMYDDDLTLGDTIKSAETHIKKLYDKAVVEPYQTAADEQQKMRQNLQELQCLQYWLEEDPQLQNDFRDPELDDYRAGSFYWAIRRAAQYEGIYADAATADAYWQSVADAINAACDNGTLPARSGRRSATSQPIRAQYVLPAIREAAKSALWALTFQDCPAYYQTLRSIGTTEDVAQWSAYLHGNFNNAAEAGKDTPYYAPLQKLAYRALGVLRCVYAVLLPLAFVWAVVRHLCALPMVLRRRTAGAALPWLLLFGLLAMAALRCGMIAFVEVSSFGIGTSTMYLSTVHPLLLLYTYGCLICYRNKGVITE